MRIQDMKMNGIYIITCKTTGKEYIGQANRKGGCAARLQVHFRDLESRRHCNPELQDDYNAGGRKNFETDMLEIVERGNIPLAEFTAFLSEREIYWISKRNTREQGYNVLPGGDVSRTGVPHTPETREKMSAARAEFNASPRGKDVAANLSETRKASWQDPEKAAKRVAGMNSQAAKDKREATLAESKDLRVSQAEDRWANPEYAAKQRAYHDDPVAKEKKRAAIRANWVLRKEREAAIVAEWKEKNPEKWAEIVLRTGGSCAR